jgi:hypothetical protein
VTLLLLLLLLLRLLLLQLALLCFLQCSLPLPKYLALLRSCEELPALLGAYPDHSQSMPR